MAELEPFWIDLLNTKNSLDESRLPGLTRNETLASVSLKWATHSSVHVLMFTSCLKNKPFLIIMVVIKIMGLSSLFYSYLRLLAFFVN